MLLAAHGTQDQAGVDAFTALTRRVGALAAADGTRVAGGFIELSRRRSARRWPPSAPGLPWSRSR
jgi:hypothetical protein